MTSEAGDTLPAFKGDTPDPSQGLPPVEIGLASTHLVITPIPDPITPFPEIVVEEIGQVGNTPHPAQRLRPKEGRLPTGRPQVERRLLAPIHLTNAATQLPYESGEMK